VRADDGDPEGAEVIFDLAAMIKEG